MLNKFFKPKWQHADVQVRLQALFKLDQKNDTNIILKMANDDPSNKVREQALNKFDDPELLQSLLNGSQTPNNWCRYAARLNQLFPQTEQLIRHFEKIKNSWDKQATLQSIAACKDINLANGLLFATNDPDALLEIATNAKSIDFRLKAIDEINDYQQLQKLSKQATHKKVIHAVRKKLNLAKSEQKKIVDSLERAEHYLKNITKLSKQSWFDAQFEIKVNSVVNHWQQVEQQLLLNKNNPNQLATFQQLMINFQHAHEVCQEIIVKYQQELEQAALEQDTLKIQQELCNQLKKLITEMNESSMQSIASFQSVKDALRILDDNWSQSIQLISAEVTINQQYQSAHKELNQCFTYWEKLTEVQSEFERLINALPAHDFELQSGWLKTWDKLESGLGWPQNIIKPEEFNTWLSASAEVRANHEKTLVTQKKKIRYLHQKLSLLEKHCQQGNLIAANKLSNYINNRSKELISDFHTSFIRKLERTQPKLDELRDWHAFATSPKKQLLCESMEQLISEEIEPLAKATKVREFQTQWRALITSDTHADDELWDRFKLASDTAYQPCLEFYAAQDKIKADNLQQRINICSQLDALITDCKWNESSAETGDKSAENSSHITSWQKADWLKLENLLISCDKQWKKYQPVPENERQSIQKHFNFSSNIIRNQLKQEKQNNLERRCELVENALKLIELEDINNSITGALKLQKQWKEIGLTFFKADRQQWQLFRSALDKIFSQRDKFKQAYKDELQANLENIKQITENIRALRNLNDIELRASFDDFEHLMTSWSSQTELPKAASKKSLNDFENICQDYQTHYLGLKQRTKKLAFDSFIQGGQILKQAEEDLLANNSSEINQDNFDEIKKQISLLACNDAGKTILQSRLEKLLVREKIKPNLDGLSKLQQLVLNAEILLSIESPENFKPQRMEIQLKQLQQGLGRSNSSINKQSFVLELFNQWMAVGFVESKSRLELEARLDKIFSAVEL